MANTKSDKNGTNGKASRNRTLMLVQFSILLAILAVFCFTPLGSIPMPGGLVATLMMIPVIITALTMGTKAGTLMGFFAGLFSFIVWTFFPPNPILAFTFTPFYSMPIGAEGYHENMGNLGSLLICFLPRTLIGTVAGVTFNGLSKLLPKARVFCFAAAAVLGSLTNTIGVLGGTWLFFGQKVTDLMGTAVIGIVGTLILTNGIPEAVVSAIVCPAAVIPIKRMSRNNM